MANYQQLFGPVLSRRFGRSLGVDLQANGVKRCTLSCIFCQLGPTASPGLVRQPDVPITTVLAELDAWLKTGEPTDFITLAGTGEPTLHPGFGRVLDWIRTATPYRSLLLSNGTLFTLPEVRRDAARADVVKVSLHAWDAPSFQRLVRPHPQLQFEAILDGYKQFRSEYAGVLIVEVFIIAGINDTLEAADRIAAILRDVSPDHIQLNVVARPPAEASVSSVPLERLKLLAQRFTPVAEIPDQETPLPVAPPIAAERAEAIAALVRRHPADLEALARTFAVQPPAALRPTLHRLAAAGQVSVRWQNGLLQVLPPAAAPQAAAPLVLGSTSPRRQRLFRELGLPFEIAQVETEEIHDASDPVGTVIHNARTKHAACRAIRPDAVIITADTLVWFAGRLIGKPTDLAQAAQFLRDFSGRTQTVFTAVAFSRPGDPDPELRIEASRVHFRQLDESLIQTYLARTCPLDRAGAYDIDENGDLLIAGHEGSYTNIVGIPMESVRDWLRTHAPELLNG
jgi:MAF protein